MGQIIIDIPNRKTRRFIIEDAEQAELLISALETAAVRVRKNPPKKITRQQMEDIQDGLSAQRALAEMRRTGKSYKWEDVKAELGL
ncbi:hypothetical protein [Leptolyngbya sp. 7M]|uniref:hypothetical protein n=1 Tax=Leptolyngbya sp. 7M TaxID=2812896 RepID=UPI001B8C2D59|nr:hypothetical protein [Leptolyngbya sp. 7M]QYO67505.1 hypothetical protein JVX88_12350 [Leptolyngbya sp. 7M]